MHLESIAKRGNLNEQQEKFFWYCDVHYFRYVKSLFSIKNTDYGAGVLVFVAILYLAVIAYKVKQVFSNSDS